MTNFTESAKWSTTFHHPEKIHSDVTNYLGPKMLPLIILLRNVYKKPVPLFITTKYNTNTKCEYHRHGSMGWDRLRAIMYKNLISKGH